MSALSDEINNDPENIGYATPLSNGNNQEVTRLINEPRTETVGAVPVPSSDLLMWGGQNGRLSALEDAASDDTLSAGVRSVADAALRMIQREDTSLDLGRSEVAGMIDTLVDEGILTSTDKTELEAMTTAKISRAQELGLGTVSLQEVRDATA